MINGLVFILLIFCGFCLGLALHFILIDKKREEIDEILDTIETILFDDPELSVEGKPIYDHDLDIHPSRDATRETYDYLKKVL